MIATTALQPIQKLFCCSSDAGPGVSTSRRGKSIIGNPMTLVLHPLAAEDHDEAERDEIDRQDDAQPPSHGTEPDLPRNRPASGQPLEIPDYGVPALRQRPLRQERMYVIRPPVFRGSVIIGGTDDGQPPAQHEDRNAADDETHRHDGQQFGRLQGAGPTQPPAQRVGEREDCEGKTDPPGKVGPGRFGGAGYVDGKGGADNNDEGHRDSEQQGSRG